MVKVTPPSFPKSPLVDENGIITPVWRRFLEDLWRRSGSHNDKLEKVTYDGSDWVLNPAKFSFFDAAAVAQQAKINDPSGGGTVDAEARTAINAIIDVLEAFGFTDTT